MAKIDLYQDLLSSPSLLQTPVIQVKIGEYEFGAFNQDAQGYKKYPNYIQSLTVTKINGQVNTYSLQLSYQINQFTDPNYFEKVFSSVAVSRRIEFLYGDASLPNYLYKNEVGIITRVSSSFSADTARIDYTVEAISQAMLGLTGNYSFPAVYDKPSSIIMELLKDPYYGLQDIFSGMENTTKVNSLGLIPSNDAAVQIEKKDNLSVLEYVQYLVSLMTPDVGNSKVAKNSIYVMTFEDDTSGAIDGTYFKITEVDSSIEHSEAYQIDIGYPGANCITNFNVSNDENYSIYYEYQNALHPQEYVSRINQDGVYEEVYAPTISSGNPQHDTKEDHKSWWTKMTSYPIRASMTIKGLIRPAVLMTYVRLNILFFGQRHINSGLYIVTKQVDSISESGFFTTLDLLRIGGE